MSSNGSLRVMISELNRSLLSYSLTRTKMVTPPFWIYLPTRIVKAKKQVKFIIIGGPFIHFNKEIIFRSA